MKKVYFIMIVITLVALFITTSPKSEKDRRDNNSSQQVIIPHQVIIDVPFIDQGIKYPTGCESVSTVMALQYLGINISVDQFINQYLDMGDRPHYKNGILQGCDPW